MEGGEKEVDMALESLNVNAKVASVEHIVTG